MNGSDQDPPKSAPNKPQSVPPDAGDAPAGDGSQAGPTGEIPQPTFISTGYSVSTLGGATMQDTVETIGADPAPPTPRSSSPGADAITAPPEQPEGPAQKPTASTETAMPEPTAASADAPEQAAPEKPAPQTPDPTFEAPGGALPADDTIAAGTGDTGGVPAPIVPPPNTPQPAARPTGSALPTADALAMTTITLPNLLTAFRCVMVFVIVVLLMWPWGPFLTGALIVFGLAALTDWLDGAIARGLNMGSDLGRMLDHIADKLLVCVTLLCLCATGVVDGLNVLAAALILGRELAISGLREHLGAKGVVVPVSIFGKWKTTFQMVAIAALLAAPLAPLSGVARFSGLVILWVAMGLTVASGIQYVLATRHAWEKS